MSPGNGKRRIKLGTFSAVVAGILSARFQPGGKERSAVEGIEF